jgi:hypothetical protein
MDDERAREERAARREQALTWAGLAAAIMQMTESQQLDPAVYVEPYDDAEAVAIGGLTQAVEDIYIEADDGTDTVFLVQVSFYANDDQYGIESYWVGAGSDEEAPHRALGLSNGSRFADDRIDYSRGTQVLNRKDNVRIVVRAGQYMLR